MVLISKLALLYPRQEPVLIEQIFVSKKEKTKTPIPPLTCIERKHKSPIVYIGLEEAVWKAARVFAWWACISVHLYMCERESEGDQVLAAGCFVVAQWPGGQQMSSCSWAYSASPLSILFNWLIYPQSSRLVPFPYNGLITVLTIMYILVYTFSCLELPLCFW